MWIPRLVTVTPVLDAGNAYADKDVLFDTTEINDALNVPGDRCILDSVFVLDEDAQGIAFDLVFLASNVALGTFNAAPAITDTNAREIVGVLPIASGDYLVAAGATIRVAQKNNIGMVLKAASTSKDLWVAGITRGAPTHVAAGLKIKLGLLLRQ